MQLRSTKPPLYCDFDRCFGYSALSCEHFHRSQLKPGKLRSLTKRPVFEVADSRRVRHSYPPSTNLLERAVLLESNNNAVKDLSIRRRSAACC
jgi:hypothetical protein